jgi:hypothetical protein
LIFSFGGPSSGENLKREYHSAEKSHKKKNSAEYFSLQPEPAEKILKENTTAQLGQKKNTRPQRFNPPISIPFEGVNHGHDKTG